MSDFEAPPQVVTQRFPWQSYFDDTKLSKALLTQVPGEYIVASTANNIQTTGYSVALHPDSETPVAVQFQFDRGGASGVYILAPGEFLQPARKQPFVGITWGLPCGWLGGGLAKLMVYPGVGGKSLFNGTSPEIIYQRQRVKILADQDPLPAGIPNFPSTFPWFKAVRNDGSADIAQGGVGSTNMFPTRIGMRLRVSNLLAPSTMRLIWTQTDDYDVGGADGKTLDSTGSAYIDVTWPGNIPGSGVALSRAYPVIEFLGAEVNLGGDNCILYALDLTGAGTLTNQYVDIIRYVKM